MSTRVQDFVVISSSQDLAAKVVKVLVALCVLVMIIIVLVEIGTLTNQRMQDKILLDTLVTMDKLPADAPTSGFAKITSDLVLEYKTLTDGRNSVMTGMTKTLLPNITSNRSAMGGIDYSPECVDMAGEFTFTGVNTDVALMAKSYSDIIAHLGLDPTKPVLTDSMIELIIPHHQVAGLVYKMYSTDPEKLESFSIHAGQDAWLQNLGSPDIKTTVKCKLLEKPTISCFKEVYGGYWCPRNYYPSTSDASRFVNGTVGNWVIECDTPKMEMTIIVVRWNSLRFSTAFYRNTVKMTAPRKVINFFPTKRILNWCKLPHQDLVTAASTGTLEPLPSTIYIVQTDRLPDQLRTVLLGAEICDDHLHAVLSRRRSKTKRAVMIATARNTNGLAAFVNLSILLRPRLRYGIRRVTYCITVKESVILILILIAVLTSTAKTVVGVGMHAGTISDNLLADRNRVIARFHGRAISRLLKHRLLALSTSKVKSQLPSKRSSSQSSKYSSQSRPSFEDVTASPDESSTVLAYDEYLAGKFFAFGVSEVNIQGRRCRVIARCG
ncbi:TPA: hypothetical protein N0F65_003182 [Lagenidium giganteum]|uniref:Uncharacterized protein n=1 Tax=Lagenidium giganteum TaxID=4803 RepID=A0AAV2ZAE7_9STRA|nr:TPA: hypothetical protein N0F65_003182 [Lagenidium giganteum]